MYQLYSEFSVFVFAFLFSFGAPRIFSERGNIYELRLMVSIVIEFIIFVVQPLLYLHGDSSFRKKNYESRNMASFEEGTILDQQQRQKIKICG